MKLGRICIVLGMSIGIIGCSSQNSKFKVDKILKNAGIDRSMHSLILEQFGPHMESVEWPADMLGFSDAVMTQDGKIVTVGTINRNNPRDRLEILISRYNQDGTVDMSFGYKPSGFIGGGFTKRNLVNPDVDKGLTSGIEWISSLSLGPDDEIIITGAKKYIEHTIDPTVPGGIRTGNDQGFVLRLTKDGLPDRSFRYGAVADINIDRSHYNDATYILDSAVEAGGKIVIVGYTYRFDTGIGLRHKAFIARLNKDGSLDGTFGGDGVVIFNTDISLSKFSSVYLQSDGKIVIGGHVGYKAMVARLEYDGVFDTSFGKDGVVEIDNAAGICDIQQQRNETILVGTSRRGIPNVLMRLTNSGQIDTSFGGSSSSYGVTKFDNGTASYGKCALLIDKKDNTLYVATNDAESIITKFLSNGRLDESFPGFGRKGHFLYGWPTVRIPGYPEPAIPRGLFINSDGNFVVVGRVLVEFPDIYLKTIYGYLVVSEPKVGSGRF